MSKTRFFWIEIWFLIIVYLSSSCDHNGKVDQVQTIDIEKGFNKMGALKMSDYASNISYISLENVEGIPLLAFSDFDISDRNIIKTDMDVCLVYDNSGRFILKFGKSGRGPTEHRYMTSINIVNNERVYFKSTRDLFEYNIDGTFLNKYSNVFFVDGEFYVTWFLPLNDSLFFGHLPNYTGKIEYKALVFNKNGEALHMYKNYIKFDLIKPKSIESERVAYLNKFNNQVFYKDHFNDTLFYLDKKYQLIPKYAFNLGKFKQPVSERGDADSENNELNYVFVKGVFQTQKYLFIACDLGKYFPAKRLTPSKTMAPNSGYSMYNTTNCLAIYNKNTQELLFSQPTSTDNYLFTSGLYNDIDGGPRFFPERNINDSTMVMQIDAKMLKDHIASSDFRESNPKYPEKKEELERLANSLTEFDNTILMLVTFNK
jgi:hypothetical protein